MALPVDPKLAKLKIRYERADAAHTAAQFAEFESRDRMDDARQRLFDYIRELGFCPRCELRLNECGGHAQAAAQPAPRSNKYPPEDTIHKQ